MPLAASAIMDAASEQDQPTLPSIFEWFPRVSTVARHATAPRKLAFWSSLAVVPAAIGLAFGMRPHRGRIRGARSTESAARDPPLQIEWLGPHDRKLRYCVRASLTDATLEEVSAALDREKHGLTVGGSTVDAFG